MAEGFSHSTVLTKATSQVCGWTRLWVARYARVTAKMALKTELMSKPPATAVSVSTGQ